MYIVYLQYIQYDVMHEKLMLYVDCRLFQNCPQPQ